MAEIFHLTYPIYTDPTLELYHALGMTLRATSSDASPAHAHAHSQSLSHVHPHGGRSDVVEEGNGAGYVKHGAVGGLAMVVRHALKVGMPVWAKGGDVAQLGGEFVLGPGCVAFLAVLSSPPPPDWKLLNLFLFLFLVWWDDRLMCTYAHRMRTRRGHAAVLTVLQAAGVSFSQPSSSSSSSSSMGSLGKKSAVQVVLDEDEEQWMAQRRRSLARMRSRKAKRRGGFVDFPEDEEEEEEGEMGMIQRSMVGGGGGVWDAVREVGDADAEWEGKVLSIVPEEVEREGGYCCRDVGPEGWSKEEGQQRVEWDSNCSSESAVIVDLVPRGSGEDAGGGWRSEIWVGRFRGGFRASMVVLM
ncbi:hypothetical protein EW146_g4757 [Bondarzewia mesenterica]|uniref:Uncharacterized protein n=1 Tax=Bondarzewia mesenterica TaxID=1095465 RepID=A0A4S4LTK9_9AGAM|nr:hypothetical protein EW146_g4757 [Bondarzewia mesenterica]